VVYKLLNVLLETLPSVIFPTNLNNAPFLGSFTAAFFITKVVGDFYDAFH